MDDVQRRHYYLRFSFFSRYQPSFTEDSFDRRDLFICIVSLLSLHFNENVYVIFEICVRDPKTISRVVKGQDKKRKKKKTKKNKKKGKKTKKKRKKKRIKRRRSGRRRKGRRRRRKGRRKMKER